jgi:glutathione S-transferase
VALLLRALDLPYRFEVADATRRKSAELRTLDSLGQMPTLRDADVLLTDSNAIMVYLVKRYAPTSDWLPDDPVTAAAVTRDRSAPTFPDSPFLGVMGACRDDISPRLGGSCRIAGMRRSSS